MEKIVGNLAPMPAPVQPKPNLWFEIDKYGMGLCFHSTQRAMSNRGLVVTSFHLSLSVNIYAI